MNDMEITTKSGMRFRLSAFAALSLCDFRLNPETFEMESVPHPSDIADVDPKRAVELAQSLGYTQDADGVWVDPQIKFMKQLMDKADG